MPSFGGQAVRQINTGMVTIRSAEDEGNPGFPRPFSLLAKRLTMPRASSASAACFMVGQSDWLPMMMPTSGIFENLAPAFEVLEKLL